MNTAATSPYCPAGTASGRARASARKIVSIRVIEMIHTAHGAGGLALNMQSSGTITRSGANAPSTTGLSGEVRHFSATRQAEIVPDRPRLIGPLTCGAEPVRSIVIVSPAIVTVTAILGRSTA